MESTCNLCERVRILPLVCFVRVFRLILRDLNRSVGDYLFVSVIVSRVNIVKPGNQRIIFGRDNWIVLTLIQLILHSVKAMWLLKKRFGFLFVQ